jgi:hypothetical protein
MMPQNASMTGMRGMRGLRAVHGRKAGPEQARVACVASLLRRIWSLTVHGTRWDPRNAAPEPLDKLSQTHVSAETRQRGPRPVRMHDRMFPRQSPLPVRGVSRRRCLTMLPSGRLPLKNRVVDDFSDLDEVDNRRDTVKTGHPLP